MLLDAECDTDQALIAGALAIGEHQIAVRDGKVLVPRLTQLTPRT